MRNNLIAGFAILMSLLMFSGCGASSSKNMIAKVYETSYPEGITVSIYNDDIKDNISLTDARMTYGKDKSQVQFMLRNNSNKQHNLLVSSEWTDKRGTVIPAYPRPQRIGLRANSGKRMVLQAPSFKAKNVLINVECGKNCVPEDE